MGKLLERLNDASKSGVYAARRVDDVLDATRGSKLRVARVDLAHVSDKAELMRALAAALGFPGWFGANWDALEDCLTDANWAGVDGRVLLLEAGGGLTADENGIFIDVLRSAAAYWAGRAHPFFAVFVGGPLPLPWLYREGQ